jgi:hypothetical protein
MVRGNEQRQSRNAAGFGANGSEITPPPFAAALLEGGKPPTQRIKRNNDEQPHGVDAGQA